MTSFPALGDHVIRPWALALPACVLILGYGGSSRADESPGSDVRQPAHEFLLPTALDVPRCSGPVPEECRAIPGADGEELTLASWRNQEELDPGGTGELDLSPVEAGCAAGDLEACLEGVEQTQVEVEWRQRVATQATLPYLRAACELGDAGACADLGDILRRRKDVESSLHCARAYLNRACHLGGTESCGPAARLENVLPFDFTCTHAAQLRACERGSADACFHAGSRLGIGAVVPRDPQRGLALMMEACRGGHGDACVHAARTLERGDRAAPDPGQALWFYEAGCGLDVEPSCLDFSLLATQLSGDPETTDVVDAGSLWFAEHYLEERARSHLARRRDGPLRQALQYLEGENGPPHPERAAFVVQQMEQLCGPAEQGAGDSGEPSAEPAHCVGLGLALEFGIAVPADPDVALQVYRRGCDGGDNEACLLLGLAVRRGDAPPGHEEYGARLEEFDEPPPHRRGSQAVNLGVDLLELGPAFGPRSLELYELGCEGGSAIGCSNRSVVHAMGWGVDRDEQLAFDICLEQCEQGNLDACDKAVFLLDSDTIPRNGDLLFELSQRVCDARGLRGCETLGRCYQEGWGVEADPVRAAELYEAACTGRKGPTSACLRRVKVAGQGGGEMDPVQQADFLWAACHAGHGEACRLLAGLFEQGAGVPRDLRAALALYQRGCELEDENPCEAVQRLWQEAGASPEEDR